MVENCDENMSDFMYTGKYVENSIFTKVGFPHLHACTMNESNNFTNMSALLVLGSVCYILNQSHILYIPSDVKLFYFWSIDNTEYKLLPKLFMNHDESCDEPSFFYS